MSAFPVPSNGSVVSIPVLRDLVRDPAEDRDVEPAVAPATGRRRGAVPDPRLSDARTRDAAVAWRQQVDEFPDTGLWPLLLTPLAADHPDRPWNSGELEPVALAGVDALDPETVLADGWADSLVPMGDNPYVEHLRPFGARFPGLSAPLWREGPPGWVPAHVLEASGFGRLGLVACRRPADVVAEIGWRGAINSRSSEQVSAVLRSWEDRFGVVLVGLGFATLTLLVPHPPASESEALPIAAEIAALCPDVLAEDGPLDGFGYVAGGTVAGLAAVLLDRLVWKLWWD